MGRSSVNDKKTLIIGAGPSGMGSALELFKAGRSVTIIEKNENVGGLARTLKYGEFITDIGPHRFFSHNAYLYDTIEELLGEQWLEVDRLTRFYVGGRYFNYPIELKNILSNIDPSRACRIIFDYAYQRGKKIFVRNSPISFEQKIISDFGRALAEFNILNYSEKIWGLPCSEISSDWASQRIQDLSFARVIKSAFGNARQKKRAKSLMSRFHYPALGSGLIYEAIAEKILSGGDSSIHLNSYPTEICYDNSRITKIIANMNGRLQEMKIDHVISSIPLTILLALLRPKPPLDILLAAQHLKFRSHVSLFIMLKKRSVFRDQWVYFPDKEIPFGRITEPKNFSKKLSPDNGTSLLVEFFCWHNDNTWNSSKNELFEACMPWFERIFGIKRNEVIDYYQHKEVYAYPVYSLGYKAHADKIKDYLRRFINLQCIGRSGVFRYNNQDHALEMGIVAARNIVRGERCDIEEPGSAKKYFEEK